MNTVSILHPAPMSDTLNATRMKVVVVLAAAELLDRRPPGIHSIIKPSSSGPYRGLISS